MAKKTIKQKGNRQTSNFDTVVWENFDEILTNKTSKTDKTNKTNNIKPVEMKEKFVPEKKDNPTQTTSTISMRVGQEVKNKLYKLALELSFREKFIGNKQSLSHIMHIVLYNMQQEYIVKYKKLLTPDDFYVNFYNKKQTKGMPLPEGIELEKEMVFMSIMITKEDKELYWQLMHTYFINEIEKKYGIVRYSVSIFLFEILKYFEKNIDNLEIID